tara:strand:- start:459 stop:974 length:516 start_codon:yes stop_codon:yes gene_type:complete
MKVEEDINKKIERDYVLITGHLDLDSNYFIKKIEEGIKISKNSYAISISGRMTDWDYFNRDKKFVSLLLEIFDYLDERENMDSKYSFQEAWGIKEGFGEHTKKHDHNPCYLSGVIYFSDHEQALHFPEIKKVIRPKKGGVVIFSSFLKHYTKRNKSDIPKYAISFNIKYDL